MNVALTFEEEQSKVLEKRVLGRIWRPKREEVTGAWTKQDDEELHNLYFFINWDYGDQIKEDEIGRTWSM